MWKGHTFTAVELDDVQGKRDLLKRIVFFAYCYAALEEDLAE